MIPQANPKANYLAHKDEIDAAIARVLDSGQYILGKEVAAFEQELADYIGVRYAVGVGSGTDALYLALRALEIGAGEEVITASFTATATVAAIELCGATPVLVDIDPRTYTIDVARIEAAITRQTVAIIPVHLYGHPADMQRIMGVAEVYGLWVIEDCAQAHGATHRGIKAGAWGDMAAFSFYPTKNLGALGDGGMVVTDDPDLDGRLRSLRQYGWWATRYVSMEPGMNSRLDEIQAAILRAKLPHLDDDNRNRRYVAERYYGDIVDGHVYHLCVIRSGQRDALQAFLKERGISTGVHYPVPIHLQPAYADRVVCPLPLVESERAANEVLSLPVYPELPMEDMIAIVEALRDFKG